MKQDMQSLDDFLQARVEEADFTYRESYWQKMAGLLDEEDRRRKRAWIWRLSLVLGLLFLAGSGALLLQHWHPFATKQAAAQRPVMAPQGQASYSHDEAVVPTSASNQSSKPVELTAASATSPSGSAASNTETHPSQNEPTSANTSHEIKSTPMSVHQTPVNPSDKKQNQPSSTSVHTGGASATQSNSSEVSPKNKKKKSTTSNPSVSDPSDKNQSGQLPISISKTTPAGPAGKQTRHTGRKTKDDAALVKNQDVNQRVQETPAPATSSSALPVVATASPGEIKVKGKTMKGTDTQHYVRMSAEQQQALNPRYVAGLEQYVALHHDSITVITLEPKPEASSGTPAAAAANPSEPNKDAVVNINRAWQWWLFAGLNLNKGMQGNQSGQLKIGVSPYLGFGGEKALSARISMAAHIGFTYFNALNVQMQSSQYQYGFGLDSSSTTVRSKICWQLSLPVSLQYEIIKGQAVFASFGAAWQPDVLSKVDKQAMSQNAGYGSPSRTPVQTSIQSGYRSALVPWDAFVQIGYLYTLNQKLRLQAMLQQGLIDQTRNAVIGNTRYDTQTRLSIGIQYSFKRN